MISLFFTLSALTMTCTPDNIDTTKSKYFSELVVVKNVNHHLKKDTSVIYKKVPTKMIKINEISN